MAETVSAIATVTADLPVLLRTISAVHVLLGLVASGHIVLTKRDVRAAIGWIGLVWLSPFLGVILYILFGINRIHRKARTLRKRQRRSSRARGVDATGEMVRRPWRDRPLTCCRSSFTWAG